MSELADRYRAIVASEWFRKAYEGRDMFPELREAIECAKRSADVRETPHHVTFVWRGGEYTFEKIGGRCLGASLRRYEETLLHDLAKAAKEHVYSVTQGPGSEEWVRTFDGLRTQIGRYERR